MQQKLFHFRNWIQSAYVLITNGYLAGFVSGKIYTGPAKKFCVPGLNCYSCPGAVASCPIGSLQAVLGSPNRISFYVVGLLLFFSALFGRFVCGFLCPFGLVQDGLFRIPIFRKIKRIPWEHPARKLKYLVLAVFVILIPSTVRDIALNGIPAFCAYLCPSGTLMAAVPLMLTNEGLRSLIGPLFVLKMSILVLILVASMKISRPFCRYLCPLGAIYSCFNKTAWIRLDVDENACIRCKRCRTACQMEIEVYRNPNAPDCVRCGDCVTICPTSAIQIANLPSSLGPKVKVKNRMNIE